MHAGRAVLRVSLARDDLRVVAINHTASSMEHLLTAIRHDSTHGICQQATEISVAPDDHPGLPAASLSNPKPCALLFRGRLIHLLSQRDATKLDWEQVGAEYIMESTGKMTTKATAGVHITHGKAKKVLISAPSKDAPNVVYGVNHKEYNGDQDILSNASCTVRVFLLWGFQTQDR
jgi:glyceraldehyde 3-phosphate dehydrogenase